MGRMEGFSGRLFAVSEVPGFSGGAEVPDCFVGFYWTLPVNWAGFKQLPKSADEAAAKSKTIRYQMERVRRHVKVLGGQLVDECVFMEVAPDRGTDAVVQEIARAAKRCEPSNAILLYVNFSEAFNWRRHPHMLEYLQQTGVAFEGLSPDPLVLDGRLFDPAEHFSAWRKKHRNMAADLKLEAMQAMVAAAAQYGVKHGSYREISEDLNQRGIRTVRGNLWTPESVRKSLKALPPPDVAAGEDLGTR